MTDHLTAARKAYAQAAYMLAHQREKFPQALEDADRACLDFPHLRDACNLLRRHWKDEGDTMSITDDELDEIERRLDAADRHAGERACHLKAGLADERIPAPVDEARRLRGIAAELLSKYADAERAIIDERGADAEHKGVDAEVMEYREKLGLED